MNNIENMQYVFGLLIMVSNRMQLWGDEVIPDLTLKEWFLLITIRNMGKESSSLKEVASISGTTRQNVRRMITSLEGKSFVTVRPSLEDLRSVDISLTQKSEEFFRKHEKLGDKLLLNLFRTVEDENIAVTSEVLNKILGNLTADIDKLKDKKEIEETERKSEKH